MGKVGGSVSASETKRTGGIKSYAIVSLTEKPEMKEHAAQWFHEKWGIPLYAYLESMEA